MYKGCDWDDVTKPKCSSKKLMFLQSTTDSETEGFCGMFGDEEVCEDIFGCEWDDDECVANDSTFLQMNTDLESENGLCKYVRSQKGCERYTGCIWKGGKCSD